MLKNLSRIYDLFKEVEAILDASGETAHIKSPCAVVTEFTGKLNDLYIVERNMSQLLCFCFPVR